ncbi:DUF3017 domain-containing protein [Nonomuraea sp. NBC_01738]|uniref:DUF3017 domain-containing protein n=1 Tax=Nonomuraea sp. NBC_01738 TaxID=2976003 RepID=UPI002E0DF3C6|nr:DUF3017 domain-containing protein [Nonomuraea sp. NBC_01738]
MTNDETWGPFPLVIAGAALAVLAMIFINVHWGAFALGAVLLVGGALRFAGYGGQLAIRGKHTDMIIYAIMGIGLVGVAMFLEYGDVLKPAVLRLLGGA